MSRGKIPSQTWGFKARSLCSCRPSCYFLVIGICNDFMASVLSAGGRRELQTCEPAQAQPDAEPAPSGTHPHLEENEGWEWVTRRPEDLETRDGAVMGMSSSFVIRQTLCSDLSLPRQSCLSSSLSLSVSSVKLQIVTVL